MAWIPVESSDQEWILELRVLSGFGELFAKGCKFSPTILISLILMSSLMQLQDAGCWTDAATLAATHLKGSDYARLFLIAKYICG